MKRVNSNEITTKTRAVRREQKRRLKMRVHGSGMKKLAGRLSEKS